MPFSNDVFISYSHIDAEWAQKLHDSLIATGIRVYLDSRRLKGGELWEQSLVTQVDESRNLVVLRSKASAGSDWVRREMGLFDGFTIRDPQRRLIAINLEGEDTSRASIEQLNDLNDPTIYAAGAAQVAREKWAEIVRQVKEAIDDQDDSLKIAVAVLTLVRKQADPAQGSRLEFDEIQRGFQLSPEQVVSRYFDDRLDWRPFGGDASIRTMLDQIIDRINIGGRQCRWRASSDRLWTDQFDDAAVELAAAPLSMVVVDTLALQHPVVYRAMSRLREFLKRSISAWVLVPPRRSAEDLLHYRDVVKEWSSPLLEEYFDPPIPPELSALHFGVHCGDEIEIQRLLRLAAGAYAAKTTGAPKSGFTQMVRR